MKTACRSNYKTIVVWEENKLDSHRDIFKFKCKDRFILVNLSSIAINFNCSSKAFSTSLYLSTPRLRLALYVSLADNLHE